MSSATSRRACSTSPPGPPTASTEAAWPRHDRQGRTRIPSSPSSGPGPLRPFRPQWPFLRLPAKNGPCSPGPLPCSEQGPAGTGIKFQRLIGPGAPPGSSRAAPQFRTLWGLGHRQGRIPALNRPGGRLPLFHEDCPVHRRDVCSVGAARWPATSWRDPPALPQPEHHPGDVRTHFSRRYGRERSTSPPT